MVGARGGARLLSLFGFISLSSAHLTSCSSSTFPRDLENALPPSSARWPPYWIWPHHEVPTDQRAGCSLIVFWPIATVSFRSSLHINFADLVALAFCSSFPFVYGAGRDVWLAIIYNVSTIIASSGLERPLSSESNCNDCITAMAKLDPIDESFKGVWNANTILVVICSALAGYNALELMLLTFTTFNVYKGLYFWSLLVASSGIIPYLVGLNIVYFGLDLGAIGWTLSSIGWMCMVSGQSVVLYSRLGIVLGRGYEKLLSFVKWMIIVDGTILHSITWVATFGSHFAPNREPFRQAYFYIEKIQMTGFCLQELIISGIYIWKALELIRTGERKHHHRIMAQLFVINLIIVLLDIGLLALEYKNLFIAEISFKELCYSVKLKLEFAILGKLVEFSGSGKRRYSNFFGDTRGFLDESGRNQSFATMHRIDTSPTVRSDTRPQWVYDVEKMDIIPVAISEKAKAESSENSTAGISSTDHSEITLPDQARKRTESDLMYADAIRIISK